jgi:uncharacterized damage-inducible protein DinB
MQQGCGFDDLMEYTAWQREMWRIWLQAHPEALTLSAGPNGDGRFTTVGDLVKHVFGAEIRYTQRLKGEPLADLAKVPSDDVEALFKAGNEGRLALKELIANYPQAEWDTPREFMILTSSVTVSPKKIVAHTLMHEIRHWAQMATICRMNGLTLGSQDFLGSPVWGGSFRPAKSG